MKEGAELNGGGLGWSSLFLPLTCVSPGILARFRVLICQTMIPSLHSLLMESL